MVNGCSATLGMKLYGGADAGILNGAAYGRAHAEGSLQHYRLILS